MPMPIPPVAPEKVGASADDYRQRNTILFTERNRLLAELAKIIGYQEPPRSSQLLKAVRDTKLTAAKRRKAEASVARLEALTSEIVVLNYGLVRDYIKRFARVEKDALDDFEGAGLVGLMRAIDSYDPTQGPFGQWALRPIKREVLRAVRDSDHQNLSPSDFERRPEILAAKLSLSEEFGRPATFDEIAEVVEATPEQVKRILEPPRLDSLHASVNSEGDTEFGDLIPDDKTKVEDQVLSKLTVSALEEHGLPVLTARETLVVCRRFGLDGEPESKLSAIGATLRLSREAVRNIEAKSIAKLSHPTVLRKMFRHGRT